MVESKMKLIIKDRYSENSILNYLAYWSINEKFKPTSEKLFNKPYNKLLSSEKQKLIAENNQWRRKYDLDVIWLKGDLNADTIFSLWMPLKMSLQCLNPSRYKEKGHRGYPAKTLLNYKTIQKDIDALLPRGDVLVEELYKFAEFASSKANVMQLKHKQMQIRGEKYHDQMPKTLFECFEGGEFSSFFDNDDGEVLKWIEKEKLEIFFKENLPSKAGLKPLISSLYPYEFKWLEEKDDIIEMLKQYNENLIFRSELIK